MRPRPRPAGSRWWPPPTAGPRRAAGRDGGACPPRGCTACAADHLMGEARSAGSSAGRPEPGCSTVRSLAEAFADEAGEKAGHLLLPDGPLQAAAPLCPAPVARSFSTSVTPNPCAALMAHIGRRIVVERTPGGTEADVGAAAPQGLLPAWGHHRRCHWPDVVRDGAALRSRGDLRSRHRVRHRCSLAEVALDAVSKCGRRLLVGRTRLGGDRLFDARRTRSGRCARRFRRRVRRPGRRGGAAAGPRPRRLDQPAC
jgi:hypothetical protein